MRPSFIYHQLQVPIVVIGFLLIIWLVYDGQLRFASVEMAGLVLLLSIAVGIHALIHFEEEVHFDFNPMTADTIVHDKPYYHRHRSKPHPHSDHHLKNNPKDNPKDN
jgi:hypothetical protein